MTRWTEEQYQAHQRKAGKPVQNQLPSATCVEYEVPMPPPYHALFNNMDGPGKIKSERYRTWISRAETALTGQRMVRFEGLVRLTILIYGGKGFDVDCDASNRIKAPEDLMVRLGVLRADDVRIVRESGARYIPPKQKGQVARCIIRIEEYKETEEMREQSRAAEEIARLADQAAEAMKNGEYETANELMSQMIANQKQMNSELKAKETED